MKKLVGRGPRSVVTDPRAYLRELASFELDEHVTGWTATRRAGMLVDSVSLEASISEAELEALKPDAEVEWTVTVRSVPDRTWFGGPTAAGSTLVSGAVAFLVTYESLEWLPRKPSVHFASATVLLVGTFGVVFALLYAAVAAVSKRLIAQMERRPSAAAVARVERLTSLAAGIPVLGLSTASAEASSP